MITSIVSAVIIFALLILVHEAGHFVMAKRSGVRVLRFSIGYPPRLFGIRRGQTDYAIGATPLGGYVRMLGDEVAEEPNADTLEGFLRELQADLLDAERRHRGAPARPAAERDQALLALARRVVSSADQPPAESADAILGREVRPDEALLLEEVERCGSVETAVKNLVERRPAALMQCYRAQAFPTQSLWRRTKIVMAGPVSNILFAPILMALVYVYGVPYTKPIVGMVKQGMPAATAGLRSGDEVLAVDGRKVESWADLSDAIKSSAGARLKIDIARPTAGGAPRRLAIEVTPVRQNEKTIYGTTMPVWLIGVGPRGDEGTLHYGPLRAVGASLTATANLSYQLVMGIAMVINGTTPARQALGGPIMIAKMAGKEAHRGLADLAGFTVMLSLELGIINLLPVPLLDGGHLFFFLLEGLRGKPLQLRHREFAMQIGLLLLVALMTFVIVNDLSHIMRS
ncbi:MAG TPA: RIP metalloprotease RseP [Candidatus Binataceae bacterium]|jgi:regulator of sigma E protease|nr:RIP metalloprotease RseP [Candidatus Binataceae bacterium]